LRSMISHHFHGLYTRGEQSWVPCHHGNKILYGWIWYLWFLSIELSSCHFSVAYNFELAARYLENLCTPVLCYFNLVFTYSVYDVLQTLSQQKDDFNNEKYLFDSITKLHFLPFVILCVSQLIMNSVEFKKSTDTF
jgi:hypothetical protein